MLNVIKLKGRVKKELNIKSLFENFDRILMMIITFYVARRHPKKKAVTHDYTQDCNPLARCWR